MGKEMSFKMPKIGDPVISDDGGEGNIEEFVLGIITDIDFGDTPQDAENPTFEIYWTDEEENEEVQKYFDFEEVETLVSIYENYMKGFYEK